MKRCNAAAVRTKSPNSRWCHFTFSWVCLLYIIVFSSSVYVQCFLALKQRCFKILFKDEPFCVCIVILPPIHLSGRNWNVTGVDYFFVDFSNTFHQTCAVCTNEGIPPPSIFFTSLIGKNANKKWQSHNVSKEWKIHGNVIKNRAEKFLGCGEVLFWTFLPGELLPFIQGNTRTSWTYISKHIKRLFSGALCCGGYKKWSDFTFFSLCFALIHCKFWRKIWHTKFNLIFNCATTSVKKAKYYLLLPSSFWFLCWWCFSPKTLYISTVNCHGQITPMHNSYIVDKQWISRNRLLPTLAHKP